MMQFLKTSQIVKSNIRNASTSYLLMILISSEPYHLKLSDEQKSMFSGWKRLGIQKEHNLSHSDQSPLMVSDKEIDLVQDTIPDCSVVSSLCAVVSRASKGHGQVV